MVAGYVGNQAQWASFASDWIKILGPRENLHMRRLRWNSGSRKLLADLAPIPDRYNLQRVIGGLWMSDYEDLAKGRISEKVANPYMIAAQICIVEVLRIIGQNERISFVFDRQRTYENVMQSLFKLIFETSNTDDRVVVPPIFKDKSQTVCLDPADFLAFQVREYKTNPDSPKARAGMPILGDGTVAGYIYSREQLRDFVETLLKAGVALDRGPKKGRRQSY